MPAHCFQQRSVTGNISQFRPQNLAHGLGQRRKPRDFAILRPPLPGLLNHRPLLALAAARSGSRTNLVAEIPFPQPLEKKTGKM